jgi:alpha-D-ribose 1-methylphosphonate 5-triphosphate synthase subunit PhnH
MAKALTTLTRSVLLRGFRAPVFDSQKVFRAVMMALAYPGKPQWIGTGSAEDLGLPSINGVFPASLAWLLTLADVDTPVWLEERLYSSELVSYIRFHTGAEVTLSRQSASFALFAEGYCGSYCAEFPLGTDDYPECSATLLIQVSNFTAGAPRIIRGPGIATSQVVRIAGLPESFWKAWHANQALYPCGLDILLSAGHHIMGLPRSVTEEV